MKLTIVDKVFVPVSVKDELPQPMQSVVTIDNRNIFSIHQKVTSEMYKNDIITYKDLHDKNGFLNFGDEKVEVTHWLKEETNKYVLSIEEMILFKRQFALYVLDKAKDTDITMAWHNIKRELQAEFENSIL